MLNIMFLRKRKKTKTLEELVLDVQKGDKELQNQLINEYKPFIAKTVSSVCKRYISETDDEFSIGLIAFNEAIEKYTPSKGSSLISFADVIIRRRVIDFIRSQSKHDNIPLQLSSEDEDFGAKLQPTMEDHISMDLHEKNIDALNRAEEIRQFQELLSTFNLTVHELAEISPKHSDARENAMRVALELANRKDLMKLLLEKKRLPIKELEDLVQVSRKTIERNRKYIIAVSLILYGDFPYMKDYIKGVLKA